MIPEDVMIQSIVNANYGAKGISILFMGMVFSERFVPIRNEALKIVKEEPFSTVQYEGHVTHWAKPFGDVRQWSLLNLSGRCDDDRNDYSYAGEWKRFHLSAKYPALAGFLSRWPTAVNARLNLMGPHSGLSPHKEQIVLSGSPPKVKLRFHLPIDTNPDAVVMLNWKRYHLQNGYIYFFNNGVVHASRNDGSSPRLHLVWDVIWDGVIPYPFFLSRGVEPVGHEDPTEYPSEAPSVEREAVRV